MPAKGVVLTESVMTHMLADIDQIVHEMERKSYPERSISEWAAMLRHAVEGSDYTESSQI